MSDITFGKNDLDAIEALNHRDVQAALAGDPAAMMSQWTDGFVLLPAAGPIMRGRAVIAEAFRGMRSQTEILEYTLDIQEVGVVGDYAFQWGTYHYVARPRDGGEATRQPDASWKIHRSIATADPD